MEMEMETMTAYQEFRERTGQTYKKLILLCTPDGRLIERKRFTHELNRFGGFNSEYVQVLKSDWGYYIGCLHYDEKLKEYVHKERISGCYWQSREKALNALQSGNYPKKLVITPFDIYLMEVKNIRKTYTEEAVEDVSL
jgi:hypothetical protein